MSEPTADQVTITSEPQAAPDVAQPMGQDLRAAILAKKNNLKTQTLDVPEWGVKVTVKELRGKARAQLLQDTTRADGTRDLVRFYPTLVILSTFDPATGDPIFELADSAELNEQGGSALERVGQVAAKISGLLPDAFQDAKNA